MLHNLVRILKIRQDKNVAKIGKNRFKKVVVSCVLAIGLFILGNDTSSSAKSYISDWDLVDIGKHLDVDGDSAYMNYVWSAKKTWNSYKSGVIRKDSIRVIEDVYVTDISKSNGSTGITYSSGKIELNKYYLKDCVGIEIQNTVTHELGHALGLEHSTVNNIMYRAQTRQTSLGSNDKDSYDAAYKKY